MRRTSIALILVAAALVASCVGAEPAAQVVGTSSRPGVETLASAVAAGKVLVVFRGNGASSGDAIEATVTRTEKAGPGELVLSVPAGTRLSNASAAAQNMVVARVRGRMAGGDRYSPATEIRLTDNVPATYLLEAYCADFEKDNPSDQNTFTLGPADPVIACILGQPGTRPVQTVQAAVWIVTGNVTHGTVNEKFPVSGDEWAAAESLVRQCRKPAK